MPIQFPEEGIIKRYIGVYRPHWEIGHIAVRVPRAPVSIRSLIFPAFVTLGLISLLWCGILEPFVSVAVLALLLCVEVGIRFMPNEERWTLSISPDCNFGFDYDHGGPIEFEGVVSATGLYGHKGIMPRKVEIVRVVRCRSSRSRPVSVDRGCEDEASKASETPPL